MSHRNPHPTDEPRRGGTAKAGRGPLLPAVVARRGFVATVVAVAVSMLVLLALPGHDAVDRAAARGGRVAVPGAGGPVGLLTAEPPWSPPSRFTAAPPWSQRARFSEAEVTITAQASTIRVPASFLGLSTEYWALPRFERHLASFENVLSLVHVSGDGPLVLRIGGDSADHTYWGATTQKVPPRFFALTPPWFRHAGSLVQAARLRLILDLNLVADSPSMAAQWAHAALTDLPHGSILGFEIGNEPDLYRRRPWHRLVTIAPARFNTSVMARNYSASTYIENFQAYAGALASVAPGVPLLGPAVANPERDFTWLSSLIAGEHQGLGTASAHRYPLSACVRAPASPQYPTIQRLLSDTSSAGIARTVEDAVALAHGAGLPFRLTELNSVTCGGRAGVSDTFATALWAPDALFELLQAGVDGVNVHIRDDTINAPFGLTTAGLQAHPLLYGLILFARTLGPNAQLVQVRWPAQGSENVKLWAVRVAGNALRVLVINKSTHSVKIDLHLPAVGPATVERLLAPSARARSGITLDGQQLGADGRWHGQGTAQAIAPGPHGYELTLPAMSAALVRGQLGVVPFSLTAQSAPLSGGGAPSALTAAATKPLAIESPIPPRGTSRGTDRFASSLS